MKKICRLLTALSLGLTMSLAFADQPPGSPPGGEGHAHTPHPPRDCSKAPDAEKKARCEAIHLAMEKCKDLKPEEHHACMKEALPKKDK